MVVGLRERGLEPMVCLHHFDQPVWLEDMGGFENPESVELFVRFARRVVEALGDVCREWLTFNEPNVYSTVGYVIGDFPPGRRGATLAALRVQRNMARAHARAYALIHESVPGALVSWAHHVITFVPDRPGHRGDRWAADLSDRMFNRPFLEVIADGRSAGPPGLRIEVPEAKGTCRLPRRQPVRASPRALLARDWRAAFNRFAPPAPDAPRGDPSAEEKFGEPYPQGIRGLDKWLARIGKPSVITENGYADALDRVRPAVIAEAVRSMHALLGAGVRRARLPPLDAGRQLRVGRRLGPAFRPVRAGHRDTGAKNAQERALLCRSRSSEWDLDRQTIVHHEIPELWP